MGTRQDHRRTWLLRQCSDPSGQPLTVERLAQLVGSSRAHVNEVLLNRPGRGGHTRRKLIKHLSPELLSHLGWDEEGRVPRGTSDVGHINIERLKNHFAASLRKNHMHL